MIVKRANEAAELTGEAAKNKSSTAMNALASTDAESTSSGSTSASTSY